VIIVTILILDIAIQGHNILVQSRMFQVDPAARSRINTAYVTNNFICGAVGSGLAGLLWTHGGWSAIAAAGVILSAFALTVWLVGRRGALSTARPATAETPSVPGRGA
jgi:predicted MFS family arabinose efflux permease